MQRRKNITLMVSVVVLIIVIIILSFSGDDNKSLAVDKSLFKVTDFNAISKVVLESRGSKVQLSYTGSKWKLNDERDADRNMIDVLFATLQQAEPKRPVRTTESDSIGSMLEKEGVKVSLFAGDQLQKSFYAGGNVSRTQAYFKLPGDKPYIVNIPGYRVYTSGIFELPASGWMDKFVFGFNWRNFKELEATFPQHPKDDFTVSAGKVYFGIDGIAQVDTARLNTFLDGVSLLTADQFLENRRLADSLAATTPVMQLKVLDIAKRVYQLRIYTADQKSNTMTGIVGDSSVAVFDIRKITPLIRPRDFFKNK